MTTTGKRADVTRAVPPRALIVTVYGLYAREVDGWFSVATLIRLMADLHVEEAAVRSSISRLKQRGMLESMHAEGVAGYGLSGRAREIVDEGDRRIFDRPRATLEQGWLLAVFSVPEAERQNRHLLRSRLSRLGFGTVSAGVWVAPGHVEADARDVLRRCELAAYVDLFRADYLAFGDIAAQVARWWDLARLQALYQDFLDAHRPMRTSWRRRRSVDDSAAFADYVHAVTAWRRLPFLDPGLAPDVLPRAWNGARAADLFADLDLRLREPAHRHVDSMRRAGSLR